MIPGFAAATFSNISQLVTIGYSHTKSLFAQIFLFENGDFFPTLVLQYAATSFFSSMTCLHEIFWSYLSPVLMTQFKKLTANKTDYTKHDYDVFTFGINYAQHCVIVGVGIVFG